MLLKIVVSALIIAIGTAEYLHITAKERKARREKLRRIKKYRAQKKDFVNFLDNTTEYFDSIMPRDNSRQRIICEKPQLLRAAQFAYKRGRAK